MTYRHPLFALIFFVACFAGYGASDAGHHKMHEKKTVAIPDANLRAVIADSLNKESDAEITTADMAMLTRLVAPNAGIGDLTGLEHATSLAHLDLGDARVEEKRANSNDISDLAPLSGLTKLRVLDLDRATSVMDISPLAELANLRTLRLGNNAVADIAPLSGATKLRTLTLGGNKEIMDILALSGATMLRNLNLSNTGVSDLASLSGMAELVTLNLNNTKIADLAPLSGLAKLKTLNINNNKVGDISPVVGLSELTTLNIRNNPLDEAAISTHVPALKERGVKVGIEE